MIKELAAPFWMAVVIAVTANTCFAQTAHVWEKQELIFTASGTYTNPYVEVTVWVDLVGPSFKKRVFGFWDGGQTFRVRLVANETGAWTWESGSSPPDGGLAGKRGSLEAIPWTEEEKQANALRRGFLRATTNHHALEHADGTPFFALGDTWWALGANRFRWYDDDQERPIGPQAGFKDYVRYRKAQGFNWVNMIAELTQIKRHRGGETEGRQKGSLTHGKMTPEIGVNEHEPGTKKPMVAQSPSTLRSS